MKNKKMNLTDLKVKSFVTELDNGNEFTLKGGNTPPKLTIASECGSCYLTYCC